MMVTASQKKRFIQWFLNHYQLQKRQGIWILNLLMNDEAFLENTHFVEQAKYYSRGLVLSSYCVSETPIRLYEDGYVYMDSEKIYQRVSSNRVEKLYIELNFRDNYLKEEYLEVLEKSSPIEEEISSAYSLEATEFLEYCLTEHQKEMLIKAIDDALDRRDITEFLKLTNQYKEINGS